MIIKYSILIFVILLSVISFGETKNSEKLTDNQLLGVYFTPNERQELLKIIQFTDSIIISKCPSENSNKSYHIYMDLIWKQYLSSKDREHLCFDHDKKIKFIGTLDKDLFDEIWRYEIYQDSVKIRGNYIQLEEPIVEIDLKPNYSKISYYFNAVGVADEKYKEIFKVMSISGGLGIVWQGTFENLDLFDFSKIEDRLWASIILLILDNELYKLVNEK